MSRDSLPAFYCLLDGLLLIFAFIAVASADTVIEAKVDEDIPSWLCSKVKEVADEVPFHNVIGFREGSFSLSTPISEKRVSSPEGCRDTRILHHEQREHPAGQLWMLLSSI